MRVIAMNEPIQPLKVAGQYLARVFNPRNAFSSTIRTASQLSSAPSAELVYKTATELGRNLVDFATARDIQAGRFTRERLGIMAGRIVGYGGAIQGISRAMHGQSPIHDERGRFNLPGVPFI